MKSLKTIKIPSLVLVLLMFLLGSEVAAQDNRNLKQDTFAEVITFVEGVTELEESEIFRLQSFLEEIAFDGEVIGARLAVWSDKHFSADTDLAEEDFQLAESRVQWLADFLSTQLYIPGIDVFNMAEDSQIMAKIFETEDARLKEALSENQDERGLQGKDLQTIVNLGGPGRAVLVVTVRSLVQPPVYGDEDF